LGLEKPNSDRDRGETFFPNTGSDLDSDETFQISRSPGLEIDESVCLLDSQPCSKVGRRGTGTGHKKLKCSQSRSVLKLDVLIGRIRKQNRVKNFLSEQYENLAILQILEIVASLQY
jgi:hypothetical protein